MLATKVSLSAMGSHWSPYFLKGLLEDVGHIISLLHSSQLIFHGLLQNIKLIESTLGPCPATEVFLPPYVIWAFVFTGPDVDTVTSGVSRDPECSLPSCHQALLQVRLKWPSCGTYLTTRLSIMDRLPHTHVHVTCCLTSSFPVSCHQNLSWHVLTVLNSVWHGQTLGKYIFQEVNLRRRVSNKSGCQRRCRGAERGHIGTSGKER